MSVLKRLFGDETSAPADNLRIVITRHGERADLALGPNWVSQYQKAGGHGSGVSYLTRRSDFREWNYDPPLTVTGERQAKAVGKKLHHLGYRIDYCYSSPAYRSIQTAERLLEGQGRKGVPINIEPGLFECPSWYAGSQISFIPPEEIATDRHFNIDANYAPVYDSVDTTEDEGRYYQRSRQLIDAIVKAHQKQGGTILLSGHAGSIETLTRGVIHRRARPERLEYEAGKVNYCNFAILERDARTRKWTAHFPSSSEFPTGGQRPIQSSIPLYSATSHYMSSHPLTSRTTGDASYRYRQHHRRHPRRYY